MNDEDKALVRKIYDTVAVTGAIDMRKRTCDMIKRYANDPAFLAHRGVLLTLLNMIDALPVST
jgi:hypothetical protein